MGCKKVKKVISKITHSTIGKIALGAAAIYTGGAALGAWGAAEAAGAAVATTAAEGVGMGAFGGALASEATAGALASTSFFTPVAEIAAGAVATGGAYVSPLVTASAASIGANAALTSGAIASGALTATEVLKGVKMGVDIVGNVMKIGADGKPVELMPSYVGGSIPAGMPGQLSAGGFNMPTAGSRSGPGTETPAQLAELQKNGRTNALVIAALIGGAAFLFLGKNHG